MTPLLNTYFLVHDGTKVSQTVHKIIVASFNVNETQRKWFFMEDVLCLLPRWLYFFEHNKWRIKSPKIITLGRLRVAIFFATYSNTCHSSWLLFNDHNPHPKFVTIVPLRSSKTPTPTRSIPKSNDLFLKNIRHD